jgi:hypothetical protein
MSEQTGPSDDENRAAGAEAVLLEWLCAVRGLALADVAALRLWAAREPAAFRAAFAAFTGIDVADTTFLQAAAGWLLGAGIRPDDLVRWTGDPADPWLEGRAVTGAALTHDSARATRVLDRPVVWPPPVRPPAAGRDAG